MKPLKILLANNTLSLLAGSETWTYTLALALRDLGHQVVCFSPELGVIAKELEKENIKCYDDISPLGVKPFSFILEEKVSHEYDVIIANHNHIVDYLRKQFPKTPIISTIHGIIHKDDNQVMQPEHPALTSGVNQFVSVSEEVQKKLLDDYGIDSIIIRNFFDVNKFKNIPSSEGQILQFLINTNYNGRNDPEVQVVREAAKIMGAKLAAIGENFSQSFDISKALTDSTVVFGMGRSVLEGVAAGRLGIVHGRWGTGGVIKETTVEALRAKNFSGRGNKLATAEEIVDMIKKNLNSTNIEWGKQYIATNHNANIAAESYVRIARELTGQAFSRPGSGDGVDPTARPFKLQTS